MQGFVFLTIYNVMFFEMKIENNKLKKMLKPLCYAVYLNTTF